jgi:RHS repeat-associated protein
MGQSNQPDDGAGENRSSRALSNLDLPSGPGVAYGLDGEGRPATASSSGTPLVRATSYNPLGATGITFGNYDGDSFADDAYTGRMTQYQFGVNGQTDTGVYTWNANGSQASLAITDAITGTADTTRGPRRCHRGPSRRGRLRNSRSGGPPPANNEARTRPGWGSRGPQPGRASSGSSGEATRGPAPIKQTCTYQHDDMGRLASSSCGGLWGQTYAFDPFGNMNKGASAGSTPFNATYNLKNQIASVGGSFVPNYDANGNLVDDPVAGTRGVNAFDAEGKPTTLEGHAGIVSDALGRVVESGGQEFVYGPGGGKLAAMSGQTLVRADIPLPGGAGAVFNASGLVYYQHSDLLGSARLASTPGRTLYSSSAYAPFGENYAAAGSINKVFTGQHEDMDSTTSGGQYDFLMREYSAAQSRWWSPDPAGLGAVDPNDPRTWNRYAYAGGTPLEATDPLGTEYFWVGKCLLDHQYYFVDGQYQGVDTFLVYCSQGDNTDSADSGTDSHHMPSDTSAIPKDVKRFTTPCPPVPRSPQGAVIDANIAEAPSLRALTFNFPLAQPPL